MVFDVNNWGSFKLGDEKYFDIKRGESSYIKNMAQGDIPYISTTSENNGRVAFVDRANRNGNLITLAYDGSIGACFYQLNPFFASEKIVTIDTVQYKMNEYLAFFLIQILKLEAEMYSYGGRKWTVEKQLKNTIIRLPVDDFGEPDYKYMQNFIKRLNVKVSDIPDYFLEDGYSKACWYLDNINQSDFEKKYSDSYEKNSVYFNVDDWGTFRLGDEKYFQIERGDSEYIKNMNAGDSPYISTTSQNNGISAYVSKTNRKGNLISLAYDGSIGACFYQPAPFFASEKIVTIDLVQHTLNPFIAMFIIQILKLESEMYLYGGRKWTVEKQLKNTKIKLPIDKFGNPDYKFMEEYIKSLPFSCKLKPRRN